MKPNSKLIIAGLTSALICGVVGSITGTFAWYGYSTRATATIGGTTISAGVNLEIGIADKNFDGSIKGLADSEDGIFWQQKSGGLRHDAIANYLEQKGYGGNSMSPVTSGSYDKEDSKLNGEISLHEFYTYQSNNPEKAALKDYFVLPLAFRVFDNKAQDYSKDGIEIYISHVEVDLEEAENQDIAKAFRIAFKEVKDEDDPVYTLLAPSREEDGETELAGLLDLNRDGFADVDDHDYGYKVRKEMVYGVLEGENSIVYADEPTDDYDDIKPDYDFPVHLDVEEHKSEANVLKVEGYEAFKQEFLGTESVLCDFTASNKIKNSNKVKPIATTSTEDGIVYLTLTAWLEGWDEEGFTDINNEEGYPFHLNLEFQMDRVDYQD